MSPRDLIFEFITKPWYLFQFLVEFLSLTVNEISGFVQVNKNFSFMYNIKYKLKKNYFLQARWFQKLLQVLKMFSYFVSLRTTGTYFGVGITKLLQTGNFWKNHKSNNNLRGKHFENISDKIFAPRKTPGVISNQGNLINLPPQARLCSRFPWLVVV